MKIGIALSGGGARGVAHIGVLKALDELGIRPHVLSGTSAGALVGALYAHGYKPDEIFTVFKSVSIFKSVRPAWAWSGLLNMDGMTELLLKHLPENTFESLTIPLTVTATDIRSGHPAYFSKGPLIPTLVASCSIPAIFNPQKIDGNLYVDGGLVDNLPVNSIVKSCDFLVGIHCNHINPVYEPSHIKSIIERSLLIAIKSNTNHSRAMCDVCIEPPFMDRFSTFDIKKAEEIFNYGYHFTKENYGRQHFEK